MPSLVGGALMRSACGCEHLAHSLLGLTLDLPHALAAQAHAVDRFPAGSDGGCPLRPKRYEIDRLLLLGSAAEHLADAVGHLLSSSRSLLGGDAAFGVLQTIRQRRVLACPRPARPDSSRARRSRSTLVDLGQALGQVPEISSRLGLRPRSYASAFSALRISLTFFICEYGRRTTWHCSDSALRIDLRIHQMA